MKRSEFLKSVLGMGGVVFTGLNMGGKCHTFSEETKGDGTKISATFSFYVQAWKNMTEKEMKEMWDREINAIRKMAWPDILKERNRLLKDASNESEWEEMPSDGLYPAGQALMVAMDDGDKYKIESGRVWRRKTC